MRADEAGLITSTYNCQVKTFTKTADGKFKSIKLNSLRAIRDIQDVAIKKSRPPSKTKNIATGTPKVNESHLKSILKRIRSSPDEEEM